MSTLVATSGVSYRVDGASLVDEVYLSVSAGEIVAVIGPNGAGKTTLMSLLAGDLTPAGGMVTVAGEDIATLSRSRLAAERAFLGQSRTQAIPFTVVDVVAMGSRRQEVDASLLHAAMEAMDVLSLRGRIVGSLSAGEHTRVELARILVQNTPLILLDEPLAALDVAHQERVMAHLRTVAAAGRGVLAVFHDLNVAAAHADRVVLLAVGAIVAEGSPASVLTAPTLSAVYGYPMTVAHVGERLVIFPGD